MKKLIYVVIAFAVGFFGYKYFVQKTALQEENQWISIFDGSTFEGWHGYNSDSISPCWTIEDQCMVFTPDPDKPGGNIITDKMYTNFKLSLEWKISEAGNSGIFWGVHEDPKYGQPYLTGPEIQVLDNDNHSDGKYETHRAGSLYDMIAPSEETVNSVGEWNTCVIEIDHNQNSGKVWLNEVLIVSFEVHGDSWDQMVANSKFRNWEGFGIYHTGHIGLQDHGDKVWFRNIKLMEL